MMRRLRRLGRSEGGAAAVEFAAVLGPLLLLIFGVFEFGRLLWVREALQETAMAGARCMGMSASSCAASGAYNSSNTTSYLETTAAGWGVTLAPSNLTLNNNATCGGVTAAKGFSSVTITYTFQSVIPTFITSLSGGKTLTSTACFPNY